MFKYFLCLVFFLCSFGFFQGAYGESVSSYLTKAEDFYDEENYKESISSYEALIKEGKISGELLFNLGNAYFRMGERGKAVAAYLGAKHLLPRDPDITHNLRYVHSLSKDSLSWQKPSGVFSILTVWFGNFRASEIQGFFLVLWFLSMLFLFFVRFFKPDSSFKGLGLFFFVFSFSFYLFFSSGSSSEDKWGAVVSETANVRSGPGESNTLLFELHEGAPVLIHDLQKGWYKAQLSDSKKGWLKKEEALVY